MKDADDPTGVKLEKLCSDWLRQIEPDEVLDDPTEFKEQELTSGDLGLLESIFGHSDSKFLKKNVNYFAAYFLSDNN